METIHRRFTRRSLLLKGAGGAGALGASALLAACGSSSGSAGASSGGSSKQLTAWWWGDPPTMPTWLNKVAAQFKAQTGIDITIDQQQTTALISNFTAAGAAHSGPGVAAQWATLDVLQPAWKGDVTPLDQLVASTEVAHWNYRQENLYSGHLYAMPLYAIGSPFCINKKLFEQAGLDPSSPPRTWDDFLTTCKTLKSKQITPIAIGNSDTFGGRWAFSFLGVQPLNSLDDLKAAIIGEASFGDPQLSEWMYRWKDLIDGGFYNTDAMSITHVVGREVFQAGHAAMSWATDPIALEWGQSLGNTNVIPVPFPKFANASLASAYTGTQSTSYLVPSWSSSPTGAAEFLKFLHQPAQMQSLFTDCQVVPADNRFQLPAISNPLQKALAEKVGSGLQVWLENWIPPSLDDNANGPGGQKLMTGASVKSVAALWDQEAKTWRAENPSSLAKYKSWDLTAVNIT